MKRDIFLLRLITEENIIVFFPGARGMRSHGDGGGEVVNRTTPHCCVCVLQQS